MTIVQALKSLVSKLGGTTDGKTVVSCLRDAVSALGSTSHAETASQAVADFADALDGGGGGDLTTVKVTFVNQSARFGINVTGAIQFESDTYPSTIADTVVDAGDTVVITAIAYKGEADFVVATQNSDPLGNSIVTSGDVTGDGYGKYYITGDCTFTMTDV